jgi:hypothetical protein
MPQPTTTQNEVVAGSPAWLIRQALRLEREKAELLAKVNANRNLLRSLNNVGALSEQERDFVETFYPIKEKGARANEDQIARTRELRARARKGAAA